MLKLCFSYQNTYVTVSVYDLTIFKNYVSYVSPMKLSRSNRKLRVLHRVSCISIVKVKSVNNLSINNVALITVCICMKYYEHHDIAIMLTGTMGSPPHLYALLDKVEETHHNASISLSCRLEL